MAELVPIPWQPHLYLTPSTLDRLVRASGFYGSDLYLYDAEYATLSPAWRAYAQQKLAYDRHQANPSRWPIASSPDTGQRNHMRGAAFDLRNQTARAQAACRLAGLVRDSIEPWHWNDPNAANMPIVPTRNATPASTEPTKPLMHPQESTVKLWLYTSSDPDQFILIDHLNKTYRVIPSKSIEEAGLRNDIVAGFQRYDIISDPVWGQIFGNGQFRAVV